MACEDANSKLVEFVTVADVDGQEFEVEVQAKLLKLKFGQYFAAEAW